MKPVVFVVEDNSGVLKNLKMTLEFNDYKVITANDGKKALEILSGLGKPPDLIISDIMMPKMNGYDFFKTISEYSNWSSVPFIFLTARSTSDDIRLGKILGVDDYITKPFKEEDLLASIKGKIARSKKISSINKKVNDIFASMKIDVSPSISEEEKRLVSLSLFIWDEKLGPMLKNIFPVRNKLPYQIEDLGSQLFMAVAPIYGQDLIYKAQGILLDIENIEQRGYLFFDSIPDDTVRGGARRLMLAVIAPKINYFESLKIKSILNEVSDNIKEKKRWNIKNSHKEISEILLTPII